jgi:hypothetical protein
MLRVRMSSEERNMLEALANGQGLTSSDIVRQFIRRERARWDDLLHVLATRKPRDLEDIVREMKTWGPTPTWGATPNHGDVTRALSGLVGAGEIVMRGGKYQITAKGSTPRN